MTVESDSATPLSRCHDHSCLAMDVGANLGLVTLRMLQAGARVIAIEPQLDLCCAASASAAFNGFTERSLFLCGCRARPSPQM